MAMRTVVVDRFGPPETLVMKDSAVPSPGPGEVLIKVRFAGVNYFDVLQRSGSVPGTRTPFVPGLEASGTVVAAGPDVSGLPVGTAVAALTRSGYAEFALCDARLVLPLDGRVALDRAAALPVAAVTAYQVLADLARLQPGETVLVHGATGGVGTMAGQIAQVLEIGRAHV